MSFPAELSIPREVLSIARRLVEAGHATYCVGGAIRDNLLGEENNDFDLATAATPQQVRKLFRRTIPVGVEHGTVAVLDEHNRPHEVTTFRKDVTTDGRHAVVEFGASLEEDLARRDFTINAIAYHPLTHEWQDPTDGQADLERKIIRAVGDPSQRFCEDYLRILRALRFAARFDFEIEEATWDAAKANTQGLQHLSAERVRDEWMKGLATARTPSVLVGLWVDAGAVGIWLNEVRGARYAGRGDSPIDRLGAPDPILVTAYLSSDPAATLERLKCSRAEIERGRRIGEHRESLPDPKSAVAVRRWMAAVGPAVNDIISIAAAEGQGDDLTRAVAAVRESKAPLRLSDLAIGGNALIELGVPEGPAVGETLRRLLDAVLEDPTLNTSEALRDLVANPDSEAPAPRAPRTAPRDPST